MNVLFCKGFSPVQLFIGLNMVFSLKMLHTLQLRSLPHYCSFFSMFSQWRSWVWPSLFMTYCLCSIKRSNWTNNLWKGKQMAQLCCSHDFLKASFRNTGKRMILSEVIPWTHKHFSTLYMSNCGHNILKITHWISLMCEKRLLISVFVCVRHIVRSNLRNKGSWVSYEVCSPEVVSVDLLPRSFASSFFSTGSILWLLVVLQDEG